MASASQLQVEEGEQGRHREGHAESRQLCNSYRCFCFFMSVQAELQCGLGVYDQTLPRLVAAVEWKKEDDRITGNKEAVQFHFHVRFATQETAEPKHSIPLPP